MTTARSEQSFGFGAHSSANGGEKIETNERFNKMIKEVTERADIQEIKDEPALTEQQQDMMDAEEDTRQWQRVTTHVLDHTHVKHFHDELLAGEFGVECSERHIRRKLVSYGMEYTKPQPYDYRRSEDAEETSTRCKGLTRTMRRS